MKIVVAPNAFKGTATAREAAAAIGRGLRAALPKSEIIEIPVADGGDGTAEVLLGALGGRVTRHRVTGPLGKPVTAELTHLAGKEGRVCVVEVARTSGLSIIPHAKRNPIVTATEGLGELIDIARRTGATEILVGLGGSGTVDGGSGLARALGFSLLDAKGKPISIGGGGIERLARIVPPEFFVSGSGQRIPSRGRLGHIRKNLAPKCGTAVLGCEVDSGIAIRSLALPWPRIVGICDVQNRLLGSKGAAKVFGPQKGATPKMIPRLEEGLTKLAERLERDLGRKVRGLEGGGAAGGLGAGLAGFLGAELRRGAEFILDVIGFDEAVRGADYVITGEGRIDIQTLGGKAPAVVTRRASERGIPVIGVAGEVAEDIFAHRRKSGSDPFTALFSIAPLSVDRETAFSKTTMYLERTAREIGKLLK